MTGAMPVDTERVAMTQPAPTPPAPPPGDPAPTPTDPTPTPTAPEPTNPLLSDLAKEREKRQRLEAILAQAVGIELKDGGPGATSRAEQISAHADQIASQLSSQEERLATYEKDLAAERDARWRAEVASEKGLTVQQAARLQGATREELTADADALVALFPGAGPRSPAPDPSQGARGGQPSADLETRIAELKAKGDMWGALNLERSKLQNVKRPT